MTYYVGDLGSAPATGDPAFRYFYGLRVDDEGNVYFTRVDLWTSGDTVQINRPGDVTEDWDYFEVGLDYFEGRDPATHTRPFDNLVYDQYRFDSKSIFYYINENGELVARVNVKYDYPEDV